MSQPGQLWYGAYEFNAQWYGIVYRWKLHSGCTLWHKDILHATKPQPAPTNALAVIRRLLAEQQIQATCAQPINGSKP